MILVTGGTGTVGSEVVKQLASAGIRFRLLARNPDKAIRSPGIEVVKGDLSDAAALASALAGVDKLFLLSSSMPGSVELVKGVIDAAKKAGVKHVVRLSAAGADAASPIQLARWHAQTEKDLKASGMAWTVLQPGYFMQNFLGSAAGIKKDGAFYGCMGQGKASLVDARDIAAVAVACLTGEGHAGKTYAITGGEALSQDDAAMKLSAAVGKQVKYVDLPPEQFKQGLLSAGLPDWLAADYVTMHRFFSTGAAAGSAPTVRALTGKTPRGFDAFARDYAASFK
ncbi:MAG: SDR family oxidoreductase [Myxococcaceae bacterium]